MDIYTLFGKQAEQLAIVQQAAVDELARHRATLALLKRVANGEIEPCQLDVQGDRWEVIPLVKLPSADGRVGLEIKR